MHEIGITRDFVDEIQKQIILRKDIIQVKKVDVRLGRSLAISEESFQFWFNHFAKDTKLAGAQLSVFFVDGKTLDVEALEIE